MNLDNPFESFSKSAFRLEALPQYIVENEKAAFNTFKLSGQVPTVANTDWPKLVKHSVDSGKSIKRLRLLSDTLTPYEQYELLSYPGLDVGEEIKINARSTYEDKYLYDFWLFDNKYITQMNYKDDGTYIDKVTRIATAEELKAYSYWLSVFEESEIIE